MAVRKSQRTRKARTTNRETYTYRCGVKVPLVKKPDQFVVRRLSTDLPMPANGPWVLRVSDHEGQDVGKLNRWALEIS